MLAMRQRKRCRRGITLILGHGTPFTWMMSLSMMLLPWSKLARHSLPPVTRALHSSTSHLYLCTFCGISRVQGTTLVHFSAQPDSFLVNKATHTTQRIPKEMLKPSR